MSQRKTNIQQQRAAYALAKVQAVTQQNSEEVQKRFKAYSNSFPAMVQMNGLGQALAFAYQKSNGDKDENKGWKLIYKIVEEWLLKKQTILSPSTSLIKGITESTQDRYQLAQAETQALFSWVKDFARAEIKGEATQGE